MGLRSNSYWASWSITSIIISVIMAVVQIIIGLICNYDFFLNTSFFLLFLIFFLFNISIVCFGFFLSTVIN